MRNFEKQLLWWWRSIFFSQKDGLSSLAVLKIAQQNPVISIEDLK